MDHHDPDTGTRSVRRKRSQGKALFLVIACILAVAIFLFWQRDTLLKQFQQRIDAGQPPSSSQQAGNEAGKTPSAAGQSESPPGISSAVETTVEEPDDPDAKEATGDEQESAAVDRIHSREEICAEDPLIIESFFANLDTREYIKSFNLPVSSKEQIAVIFQKLAATPPVVARETDDLLTILKNTAHFFRVIGKDNIRLAKSILDEEHEQYEDILASLYRLSGQPDCLRDRLGLNIPESAYYEYACFFLNTMGGRLYLFRRDSALRMLVSYYAIRVIDHANQNSTNSHGVDIRPAINSLLDEIEKSGNQLKFKESYLEELFTLKEKYPEESEH